MQNPDQAPQPGSAAQALSQRLTASVYNHLVHILSGILPPPPENTEEARCHRDQAAMAEIATLQPVNADEAHIAARCVALNTQADYIQRLIVLNDDNPDAVLKLHSLLIHMDRNASSKRHLLLRIQNARLKREQTTIGADTDAWTHHIVLSQLTEAMNSKVPAAASPPDPPSPTAKPPPPPAPPPAEPPLTTLPRAKQTRIQASPRDLAMEAEHYAILHPKRAQQIRAHRGLPPNYNFGPPDPELLNAIINGATPALKAVDPPTTKT